MERFAAMVAGRRAAPAPKPAGEEEEGDKEYLRIQLEEIVIVKDDAYDALAAATAAAAAHSRPTAAPNAHAHFSSSATPTPTGTASTSMENCARAAAAAAYGGPPTRGAAAQGAWTTAARGVGFD
ncbi:uncharacterized protein [Lolium perenne]|uniref:uncharacterized protein n=1 Tax=Lolium perenne TaxID=4522 RepID=UPI0021EA3225|nr:uncharacterized protein LOC127301198 [Lolium perenne]